MTNCLEQALALDIDLPPTPKQLGKALHLLESARMTTAEQLAECIDPRIAEMDGSAKDIVRGMTASEVSNLIDDLVATGNGDPSVRMELG